MLRNSLKSMKFTKGLLLDTIIFLVIGGLCILFWHLFMEYQLNLVSNDYESFNSRLFILIVLTTMILAPSLFFWYAKIINKNTLTLISVLFYFVCILTSLFFVLRIIKRLDYPLVENLVRDIKYSPIQIFVTFYGMIYLIFKNLFSKKQKLNQAEEENENQ